MNWPLLFVAELRREFILLVRYPFELVSRLVWNLGFALMIFFGFQTVGAGLPGFEEGQLGRLLGLLITYIAINGLNNGVELITEETQTGTLEQAALSPPPLVMIVLLRDLASYVEMLVRFSLVLGIAMAVTGARFHLDIGGFSLLLTLMYAGMEGLGLILAGLTLLYKRIATLAQFAVMLVFGLAILPLNGLPGWMGGFVANFPFTQALILMREVGVKGTSVGTLLADGSLTRLAVNSAVYLILGLVAFGWAERTAREWGTLNQY
jgi:ABC-2 type transport system permease protein